MITADVSCRLLEIDYAGIENALTGWCLWRHEIDPQGAYDYIRWGKLGLHSAVTARYLGKPADIAWPEAQIRQHLDAIKSNYPIEYDVVKHVDHGTGYGLTPYGMVEMFPKYFKTTTDASRVQSFLFQLAPGLPRWHNALRKQAKETGFLGGPTLPDHPPSIWDHPYGYRHWFWDVLSYQPTDEVTARRWLKDPKRADRIVNLHGRWFKIVWGGDSKRVIAFYPQSIAAGVLKRAELRLFHPDSPDYIGDCYFGRTPLLGPIHDALLLMIPHVIFDRIVRIVVRVMQSEIMELPIPAAWGWGNYLRIGVEAKAGRDWSKASMTKLSIDPIGYGLEHPSDAPVLPREEADADDWSALSREVA